MTILNNLKTCYEGPDDSLGSDFIKPCLKECILYKRETAWFRSSVIRAWGDSLINILNNEEAKIEIIAYPQIDKSTKIALDKSLNDKNRNSILQKHRQDILLKVLKIDLNSDLHNWETGKDIGQTLSYLIADEKLEIRFATCVSYEDYQVVPDDADENTLTHGKRGYFNFPCGTSVSFSGSANESHAGLMKQGENFDVFDSRKENQAWKVEEHKEKVDATWEGKRNGYKIEEVSRELLNKIKVIVKNHKDNDKKTMAPSENVKEEELEAKIDNAIPDFFWKHKKNAIKKFLDKEKGILEMATGTGKTSTALEIARQLLLQNKIDKVVVVPPNNNALCDQWYNEILEWEDEYLSGNYLDIYQDYHQNKERQRFIDSSSKSIIVVSRSHAKLDFIFQNVSKNRTLIIQDEVHNFGSASMQTLKGLQSNIKYTLGLSATPERIHDKEATSFIYEELGPVIYEYPMEKAIEDKILCPFDYHTVDVELTDEEKIKMRKLIKLYNARMQEPPSERMTEEEFRRRMANIKNEASNKKISFNNFIQENSQLVRNSIIFCHTEEQARELGNYVLELGVDSFGIFVGETRDDTQLERLKNREIDCLISCKVLNEGIDVPSLENIFLLASPSTPLTTIQRIGRCIRTDPTNPNKTANVIDFIVFRDIFKNDIIKSDEERREWLNKVSSTRPLNGKR